MQAEDIEQIDREFTYGYERDRINERVGIWSLFFTVTTVYGLIGLQNIQAEGQYLLALYPLMVSCFAQHIADSQISLAGGHKLLYQQEKEAGATSGAQHFFKSLARKAGGGNKKAMRKAFTVSSLLATALIMTHMQQDHIAIAWIALVGIVELYFVGQTIFYLTYWKPIIATWKKVFCVSMKNIITQELKDLQVDVSKMRLKLAMLVEKRLLNREQITQVDSRLENVGEDLDTIIRKVEI